jgi:uncharacterized membrane protein YdjX (TVP38/TMEM64 family)
MSFLADLNVFIMTLLFLLITSVGVVFCFPTGILGLSGGYLFGLRFGFTLGFILAIIVNLVGNSLGCAMTYKVSIWLASEKDRPVTKEDYHPILWGMRKALEKKGRQINTLLRLTPIVPGAMLNYCLPPLGTKFDDFIFGSFFGTIPYAVLLSILGSMLNDSSSIETFLYHTSVWITIPIFVLAFSSLFAAIYLTYKYANEALQAAMREEDSYNGDKNVEQITLLHAGWEESTDTV